MTRKRLRKSNSMKRQLIPYIILIIIIIIRKANLYLRKIENIEISSFFIIGLIVDKGR